MRGPADKPSSRSSQRSEEVRAIVTAIAPPAPTCFESRSLWHEYLASAIEWQMMRAAKNAGPLAISEDGSIRRDTLNPKWTFCEDCAFSELELAYKQRRNECDPLHWQKQVPQTPETKGPQTAHKSLRAKRRTIPILVAAGY